MVEESVQNERLHLPWTREERGIPGRDFPAYHVILDRRGRELARVNVLDTTDVAIEIARLLLDAPAIGRERVDLIQKLAIEEGLGLLAEEKAERMRALLDEATHLLALYRDDAALSLRRRGGLDPDEELL